MNIEDITALSRQIRKKYDVLNAKNGIAWKEEDFMSGFVGDVGDLTKLIMMKRGLRGKVDEDLNAKIAHELADCLWSICVLADKNGIDLAIAFSTTMKELDEKLNDLLKKV